ncbi:porin [Acetobacter aceti NRIC 0242]|uniref:Porin n=1 Tax=Acetobacter aceti NBRC 14818 TaxID=887700 RepID=A0AB33IHE0_ACEAC|nr:carbohydrate porin [Acetobacter aceti]TCS33413.1 OprB family porin [Acetobacter aceti NBRC 14818]BCK77580.1 porin [Acetobacter aceti NBRC 14818]GAN56781.1 porin B carbohydrate-selective OprB [Acetobacter aceti NBRC 14818]GBO80394.1 porin [Acetobacter aceti NRIC 0242]
MKRDVLSRLIGAVILGGLFPMTVPAQAADNPPVTDVLPSGVPLPFPSTAPNNTPQGWDTTLLGDPDGVRSRLRAHGVRINLQDVEELWGVASGGISRGATYNGATIVTLNLDTAPLFGWHGGLFNISAIQLRGRSATADRVGAINTLSGYDAGGRNTRLFEMWYGQGFWNNRLDIRLGAIDPDTEFLVSDNASLFLNSDFGWPGVPSANLYGGGPSWPMSVPGIRARIIPTYPVSVLVGVMDDNPTGGPFFRERSMLDMNPTGTQFSLSTGVLALAEVDVSVDAAGLSDVPTGALPGVWKLGGFYDSGAFPDRRYDTQGHLLAASDSNGQPLMHHGNWMIYGIVDQTFWNPDGDDPKAASVFARIMGTGGKQNSLSFGVQAGFTFHGIVPWRSNDVLGLAWGMSTAGSRAWHFNRDSLQSGADDVLPLRTEHHIELTWQAPVCNGVVVQPDFQYIHHVGGGILNAATGRRVGDAAVFGLNMTTSF